MEVRRYSPILVDVTLGAVPVKRAIKFAGGAALRSSVLRFRDVHRTGIPPLGGLIAVDKFYDSERRIIAVAETGLKHARVAARAALIARTKRLEQLLHHLIRREAGKPPRAVHAGHPAC